METKSSKDEAVNLARRGFAVFPIKPRDKTPATEHGFKDASTDPAVVGRLFAKRPDLNVGIATGPASGVWVLDVEAEGIGDLDRLQQQHGKLPETVVSITGGGGLHYLFAYNGVQITNRTKVGGVAIDVRGDGGYIVTPPSIHNSGKRYEWERAPGSVSVAQAPEWLVEWVTNRTSTAATTAAATTSTTTSVSDIVPDRAAKYLAKLPPAISGQGGHDQTFHAACVLVLGFALSPEQALPLLRQWNQTCEPPWNDRDLDHKLTDANKKGGPRGWLLDGKPYLGHDPDLRRFFRQHDSTPAAETDDPDAIDLPEPVEWPVLDQHAYQGIAGQIVSMIEPETEADPVAILTQLLVAVGSMFGRGSFFRVEGTSHHANLFAVLVGTTARGRKGTSEGRVRQILRSVDAEWTDANIKTGLVSGEGLVWSVRDPIYRTENIKEKGRIVGTEEVLADAGVEDKRLLVIESEFASTLRVCKRETNTLSPTLRSAWDSGTLRTMAKNSPAKATDAHISIVAHITAEELRVMLAEVDGFNGFANRFLWVAVRRSKFLPDGGRDLDLTAYGDRLALAVEKARSGGRMERDQGAAALWRRSYPELADDDASGLLAAVTSRAEAQVLRLSMIYALLDCGLTIKEEHLQAALAVWRYCRSSAAMIFGHYGDPLEGKVLEVIRQQPGAGRREIHKALGGHTRGTTLVDTLARLRDAGKIRVEKVETGGRTAERWFSCEQSELSELRCAESTATPQREALSSHSSHNSQAWSEFAGFNGKPETSENGEFEEFNV